MTIVFNGGNINSLQLTLPALRAPLRGRGIRTERLRPLFPSIGGAPALAGGRVFPSHGGVAALADTNSPPVEGAGHEVAGRVATPGFRRGLCRFRKEEKPENFYWPREPNNAPRKAE